MKKRWSKLKNDLLFSVGMQIGVVLMATNVLFVLFAVYNQATIRRFNARYNQEIRQYDAILELKKGFAFGDALFYDYIKTGDETLLNEYKEQSDQAKQNLMTMSLSASDDDDIAYLLASVKQSFESYQGTYEEAVRLYQKVDYGYYNSLTYGQRIIKYMEKYADELLRDTLQREVRTSSALQKRQSASAVFNMVIAVSVTCMILVFCFYIYRNVTAPLDELSQKAREMAEGDLNVSVREMKRYNNVSTTSKAFNKMAESVRASMENERKKVEVEKKYLEEQRKNMEYEKLLNEARFMALQTQTNPHFLFNTLNSISRTITFGRDEQAQMMLEALASLMRYNLTDANIPVSLKQELDITGEYLKIQKLRFSDRLRTEVYYDEKLAAGVKIPRFTLQPLVENSIVHGIGPKRDGGRLVLDVKAMGDYARIRIFDNGQGIKREALRNIQEGLLENKSKRIGIWNTYQRMVLFTKDSSSFKLISKAGTGTMVILKVPVTEVMAH